MSCLLIILIFIIILSLFNSPKTYLVERFITMDNIPMYKTGKKTFNAARRNIRKNTAYHYNNFTGRVNRALRQGFSN